MHDDGMSKERLRAGTTFARAVGARSADYGVRVPPNSGASIGIICFARCQPRLSDRCQGAAPRERDSFEDRSGAPIRTRFAKADADRGKAETKVCMTCHTLEKDDPNKVGPNLWGVVDRPRASHPACQSAYSACSMPPKCIATDYMPGRRTFSSSTMWMRQYRFWRGWLQSGGPDTALSATRSNSGSTANRSA